MCSDVGVVIIGRNEGDRLVRCLVSLSSMTANIVYVDSASTDDSVQVALGRGVEVLQLDMTKPFTAARARNEGFFYLRQLHPEINYVQFVDGDCEVASGWLDAAEAFLSEHSDFAVVCGRRRERFPHRSIYNLMCDLEWDTPVGEAKACGGDALFRADTFSAVAGFQPHLIAGEEPEMCVRLRAAGWKIWRLDAEMTLHDAAIIHFSQWWKRTMRGGFAFAEGAYLHGAPPEMHRIKECCRAWFWVGLAPASVVASSVLGYSGLFLLLVYPMQIVRLASKRGFFKRQSWLIAFFMLVAKFAEIQGQFKFLTRRFDSHRVRLIEYK